MDRSALDKLVEKLKSTNTGFLFRYGTSEEVVRFPYVNLDAPTKSLYDSFMEALLNESMKRNHVWLIWQMSGRMDKLQPQIDAWFTTQVAEATTFTQLDTLIVFLSDTIKQQAYEKVFEVVTPEMLTSWYHWEWRKLERMLKEPEGKSPRYLMEAHEKGNVLFKSAVDILRGNPDLFEEFKSKFDTEVGLKSGGTGLKNFFR